MDLLNSLLSSLEKIEYQELEIIVVDNHSEDETENMIKKYHQGCIYFKTDNNIGVGARNIGLNKAKGEIVICLDDDVFGIDDYSIKKIIQIFSDNHHVGAINFKIIDHFTSEQCNWVHHCKREEYSDSFFETYEITEGAVAFRKEALGKSGLYAEYFFIGHEGPDLAFRLMDNGYSVVYTGDVTVNHCHSNLGRKTWHNYYYDTRNQYWLAARNFPISYALKYLLRGQISTLLYSVRDGFFSYWLKAVMHGISGLPTSMTDRKVVSENTIIVIASIDKKRPSIFYMIKNRVFKRGMRL